MSTGVNWYGRSFLNLADFTAHEIVYLLDLVAKLNADKKAVTVATLGD